MNCKYRFLWSRFAISVINLGKSVDLHMNFRKNSSTGPIFSDHVTLGLAGFYVMGGTTWWKISKSFPLAYCIPIYKVAI